MSLTGPSRTITIEPIEAPERAPAEPPAPQPPPPEPPPREVPVPERVGAR